MPTQPNSAALFQYRGVPAPGQLIPLGLQHVVASIVGIVTPAILISNTCGLSPADQTLLIQVSLVITALATLLQLFPLFRRIGAGLPVIMGISFAYVPTLQSIGMQFDLPTILGAELVGGMVAIVFGVFVKQIRPFFPPLVTGTVIFTIGLSLYSTAIRYMASGSNPADPAQFGSVQNWVVAFITFAVVVFFNNFTKGTLKLGAILIGMVVGYLVAWLMGMVSFDSVASAGWFQVAAPLHFGISFEPSACVSLAIVYVVNAVQTMGDLSSTTLGGMDRLPTATYSQNVGIVTVNRVINRLVFTLAAAVLLVAGLVPKFSSVLTTIPQSVIGGATVSVFAMITMTGIRMITSQKFTMRSSTVVGLSVALGMGVTQVSGSLAGPGFPGWVTTVFGSSSVVLATMMAIFLNLILPKDPPEEEAQAQRVEAVIEEAAQEAERETQ